MVFPFSAYLHDLKATLCFSIWYYAHDVISCLFIFIAQNDFIPHRIQNDCDSLSLIFHESIHKRLIQIS